MLTYRWRRRVQVVMFSWLVSSPFAIIHDDVWILGHRNDPNDYMVFMNAMRDMSQFVVVAPFRDESSATLADNFMQHVLMKFGICHLVVLDDGIPIKGALSLCVNICV